MNRSKAWRIVVATFAAVMMLALFTSNGIAHAETLTPGAVYVLTNATSGNAVAAFHRASNGALTPAGMFATGGNGTGGGLGSQGALVLDKEGRHLFAVNAGSNDISAFDVRPDGLHLRGKVASGGAMPISLTVHDDWLYVLNAGGTANITGFRIDDGKLQMLAGSTRPLSTANPGPAQVQFSPDGRWLAVTEKSTSRIDTYRVGEDGRASAPMVSPSSGAVPFGFDFDRRGHLIVSEAGPGAVSSYAIAGGNLVPISPSVIAVGQQAACWLVVSKNSRYAYTANAHSGTITGYRIAQDGKLTLLNANGITATTGGVPLDMDFSHDGQYLYVFNTGLHNINAFRLNADGSLAALGNAGSLPASAAGIAAW